MPISEKIRELGGKEFLSDDIIGEVVVEGGLEGSMSPSTSTPTLDITAGMQVLCDPANGRYAQMREKFAVLTEHLDNDERRYLNTMMSAVAVAVADHGTALLDDIERFEQELVGRLELTNEEVQQPVATGFFCAATIRFNCATRLFRC